MRIPLMLVVLGVLLPARAACQQPPLLAMWGTHGSGDGQFLGTSGVAVDSNGRVYVADFNNHRVQVFAGNGEYMSQWGSFGSEPGQFFRPQQMATDGVGRIYVADSWNGRIQVFDANGVFLTNMASGLGHPPGVAADGNGRVYVVTSYHWVVVYAGDGTLHHPVGI